MLLLLLTLSFHRNRDRLRFFQTLCCLTAPNILIFLFNGIGIEALLTQTGLALLLLLFNLKHKLDVCREKDKNADKNITAVRVRACALQKGCSVGIISFRHDFDSESHGSLTDDYCVHQATMATCKFKI